MIVATITTTIAVAIGIRATVVAVQVTRGNFFTARSVSAGTRLNRRKIALANVEAFNTSLTVAVTTKTTTAAVTMMAVTVAAHLATRVSGTTARSASVWIQVMKRTTTAKATKEVAWQSNGLVMADVTTTTTTVDATGTRATAAERVATVFSLSTARTVNALTHPRKRKVAQALAVVVPKPILETNDVMTRTTIAGATGTTEIAVANLAIISSSRIARLANVWTRLRRKTRKNRAMEPAPPLDGKVTNAVTTGITTAVAAGTVATAVERVVTNYSIHIAPNASAKILRKLSSVQGPRHVLSNPMWATNVVMTKTTTVAAIGTMEIAAGRAVISTNSLIARPANAWIRQQTRPSARAIVEAQITKVMATATTITTTVAAPTTVATAAAKKASTSSLIVKSASVRIHLILTTESKKGRGSVTQLRLTAVT